MQIPSSQVQADMERLVEELRSSGYNGRDLSLMRVNPRKGRRITALRQLEVMASHVASAWLDGEMNDIELLSFVQTSFLPNIIALSNIVQGTLDVEPAKFSRHMWDGVPLLIQRLQVGEGHLGEHVFSLLIAAMALRKLAEAMTLTRGRSFIEGSSNVAPEFFQRCVDKLGHRPLEAADGVPLVRIASALKGRMEEPLKPALKQRRNRSA